MDCRFFKQCPHPDDKQRKQLSRDLGLEPLQVKFWFQNKRTQMKVLIRSLRDVLVIASMSMLVLCVSTSLFF
jgi:homeobox-leucine zipper protein